NLPKSLHLLRPDLILLSRLCCGNRAKSALIKGFRSSAVCAPVEYNAGTWIPGGVSDLRLLTLLLTFFLAVPTGAAQLSPEQRATRYMDSVRHNPGLLLAFLRDMPKGADLHNHLAGAIYAESWINFAVENGLCVDRTTSNLIAPPCDSSCERFTSKPSVRCAHADQVLYNSIIDAWSMRNWVRSEENSG